MFFAFVFFLAPLLFVVESAASNVQRKSTFYRKPESWMLKPLSADHKHYKPSTVGISSTVDEYTYWLVNAYYSTTGMYCNAEDVIMKTAVPSNYCLETSDFTSMMYQCYSEYYCYLYEYSDGYCGSYQTSSYVNLYICQPGDADDDGYVTDEGTQYTSQQVIVQRGYPVPLPGNSTTLTYYSGHYCDQSSMNYYRLAYPNKCYNNYDGQNRTSTQYINPNLVSYSGNGCEVADIESSVPYPPNVCQANTNDYSSTLLVLNYPKPATVPLNTAAIVGATVGGFAAIALLDAMLYFFVPPQPTSDSSSAAQAQKGGEF